MNVNDPRCDCVMVNHVELECNHCTKAAQVAAIRQRCSDVAIGIIDEIPSDYIGDWHPKKLVRYGYAIEAMLELPTGIVVEQQFTSLDSLAAWLWERGVRG